MKNCVGCGKPALSGTGHIHTEIGSITAGWCTTGGYCVTGAKGRGASPYCTSISPSECCYGDYKLSEIELREPLTAENLLAHANSQEFSRMVDLELRGGGRKSATIKKPKSFWRRLFS